MEVAVKLHQGAKAYRNLNYQSAPAKEDKNPVTPMNTTEAQDPS